MYRNYGSGWDNETKLVAVDGALVYKFGNKVAISGSNIAIGAYGDRGLGSSTGSVFIFNADTGLVPDITEFVRMVSDSFKELADVAGVELGTDSRPDGEEQEGTQSSPAESDRDKKVHVIRPGNGNPRV